MSEVSAKTTVDKLKMLMSRCKCGCFVSVNEHRNYHETVRQFLSGFGAFSFGIEIDPEVKSRMIDTNTVVRLVFYPDTPIGSYDVLHYDIDAALDIALDLLAKNERS